METMELTSVYISIIVAFFVILLASAVRILREYERGVIFRLGRLVGSNNTENGQRERTKDKAGNENGSASGRSRLLFHGYLPRW